MFPKFQDLSDITDANSLNSLSSKLESLDFVNNPVIVNGGQLKVSLNVDIHHLTRSPLSISKWQSMPWRDHTHGMG